MNGNKNSKNPMMTSDWMKNAVEYWLDSSQRWILFMDILRKRGNNYFETIKKGEPPVLVFDYEVILEGRTFDRQVNYDLARIQPRKTNSRMRNLSRFGWMTPNWWRTWMATRSITPGTTKVNS